MNRRNGSLLALLAFVLLPGRALAHAGHGGDGGLTGGFLHPLLGLDHLLAMVAVGIWAAQQGGQRLWQLPLGFMCFLIGGWLVALAGLPMPGMEPVILVSVLVLGLLIAGSYRSSLWVGCGLVGFFALFHGYAHGIEMAGPGAAYGLGFLLTTAVLQLAGMGLCGAISAKLNPAAVRFAGAAIVVAGIGLML